MRKVFSMTLMFLGIIILVISTVALARERLSLPIWSLQTEGKYVAYGLHQAAYLMWEIPIGTATLLSGFLLWPFKPRGRFAQLLGGLALVIVLASAVSIVQFAGLIVSGFIQNSDALSGQERIALLFQSLGFLLPLAAMIALAALAARKLFFLSNTKPS